MENNRIVFQWSIKQGIYQLTYSWDYTWITGLLNAPDKAIKLQKAAAFFCFSLISIFNIIKYLNPESSVRHCWFNCHTNNSHLFSYLCAFPTEIQKARMHQLLSSSGAEQLSWTGLCSCAQHGANPHLAVQCLRYAAQGPTQPCTSLMLPGFPRAQGLKPLSFLRALLYLQV